MKFKTLVAAGMLVSSLAAARGPSPEAVARFQAKKAAAEEDSKQFFRQRHMRAIFEEGGTDVDQRIRIKAQQLFNESANTLSFIFHAYLFVGRGMHTHIDLGVKNVERLSASRILETMQGDCEHSVLLFSALLAAQHIPVRLRDTAAMDVKVFRGNPVYVGHVYASVRVAPAGDQKTIDAAKERVKEVAGTLHFIQQPVFIEDSNGLWVELDTTLVPSRRFSYENVRVEYDIPVEPLRTVSVCNPQTIKKSICEGDCSHVTGYRLAGHGTAYVWYTWTSRDDPPVLVEGLQCMRVQHSRQPF